MSVVIVISTVKIRTKLPHEYVTWYRLQVLNYHARSCLDLYAQIKVKLCPKHYIT